MKKPYQPPELEITRFEPEPICASGMDGVDFPGH